LGGRGFFKFQQRGLHYVLATLAFVLALLAKPTAVVVPLLAWIIDFWLLGRPVRKGLVALSGWMILALAFVALTAWVQPHETVKFVTPVWVRPLVAGDALAFYLYKLVVPLWLTPDYGRTPEFVLDQLWGYFTWLVPFGVALLAWLSRGQGFWLMASLALFIVPILPVSGLVPFTFQHVSTVADRYLYLAMLGPALAFAWFVANVHRKIVPIAAIALLVLLGVTSWLQARIWRDAESLWRHTISVNPMSSMAHYNLALVLRQKGNLAEAIALYRKSLETDPRAADAHYNLGSALEDKGQVEEAMEHYRRAIEIDPSYWDAHNNLAILLENQGKIEQAIKHYRAALQINPGSIEAHYNLGIVLARNGRFDEAVGNFRAAVQLQPDFAEAHQSLAQALARQGKREEATQHHDEALRLLKNRRVGSAHP
jgi:Tfp pilus assembly protein PilF